MGLLLMKLKLKLKLPGMPTDTDRDAVGWKRKRTWRASYETRRSTRSLRVAANADALKFQRAPQIAEHLVEM